LGSWIIDALERTETLAMELFIRKRCIINYIWKLRMEGWFTVSSISEGIGKIISSAISFSDVQETEIPISGRGKEADIRDRSPSAFAIIQLNEQFL